MMGAATSGAITSKLGPEVAVAVTYPHDLGVSNTHSLSLALSLLFLSLLRTAKD